MGVMELFDRLYPMPRSLSGNGVRETLRVLQESLPLTIREYVSGRCCFGWQIPKEWNIRDAFIKDRHGERIVDYKRNNLHVLGYSLPIHRIVSREELFRHLHTDSHVPNAIPYRTSYYSENWGFCVEHDRLQMFADEQYEVCIDATLEHGSLSIGEVLLRGTSEQEVIFSTYVCHPSLANDNLSGVVVQAELCRAILQMRPCQYTYRFLFVPETIGPIMYLADHGEHLKKSVCAGFVITCVGTSHPFVYKRSRRGSTLADRAAIHALLHQGTPFTTEDWCPTGSDERQYCSSGFNLPVGSLMRLPYGRYEEYHTSPDNRRFVS